MPDQPTSDDDREARRKEIFAARHALRARLVSRLEDEDADDLAARLARCGEPVRLTCTCCGIERTAFRRCDLKWCPACAPLLAHRAVERFTPAAREMKWPLFVTFTVKNFRDKIGLRDTRRAFTKLRRLRWWKLRVRGGVAQFELTNRGKGWHPHCHALLDCHWLSVTVPRPPAGTTRERWKDRVRAALTEVAAQWSLALGRKGSVKVRATFHRDNGDPSAGLRETIKYACKPADLDTITEPIAPLIRELSMTRNLVTWGTLYKHPSLKKRPRESRPCECGEFGTMLPAELVERYIRSARNSRAK